MSEIVNVRLLTPGTKIVLVDGATAEITANPGDGVWLFARRLVAPDDPAATGGEEMIFAQDVAAIAETRQ
ncbi:MAG TPA: hypothetical protein VE993_13175 [Stellaceae bacterium]|nr:hypothetical protein [Stellaceae bacterium]